MEELDLFRQTLLESKKESTFRKVANSFSEHILDYDHFPEEYLKFLVELLSNVEFYVEKGVFHFLAMIGVDTDIMSASQLKTISDTITENFINYKDDMLCLTSCDFFAHYYPYEEAKKILLSIKEVENNKAEQGYAEDGLRTLEFNHQS